MSAGLVTKSNVVGWPPHRPEGGEEVEAVLGDTLEYRLRPANERGLVVVELWNPTRQRWDDLVYHQTMESARRGLAWCRKFFPDSIINCSEHGCRVDIDDEQPCPQCALRAQAYPPQAARFRLDLYQALVIIAALLIAVAAL